MLAGDVTAVLTDEHPSVSLHLSISSGCGVNDSTTKVSVFTATLLPLSM